MKYLEKRVQQIEREKIQKEKVVKRRWPIF